MSVTENIVLLGDAQNKHGSLTKSHFAFKITSDNRTGVSETYVSETDVLQHSSSLRKQKKVVGLQRQHSNFLQYNLFTLTCTAKVHYLNLKFDETRSGVVFEEVSTLRCCYKPLVGGNECAS